MREDTPERGDDPLDEEAPGASGPRRLLLIGLVLLLVGLAAAGGVLWGERRAAERARTTTAGQRTGSEAPAASGAGASPATPAGGRIAITPERQGHEADDGPVEVVLTAEAVERAGIKTAVVRREAASAVITVPGTVTSNAYRDTKVQGLVGGIVRHVAVELGSTVERGEVLAVVFSPELADAQMKYLSVIAMLRADHQKRVRTEKLVEIGAASRQELEEVTALHEARETEVAAARQRLLLLGLSPERVDDLRHAGQVVSDVAVPSPARGIVISRHVNPGQVVGAAQELFAVVDLGTVWVIGDLYEPDFARVTVGAEARITVPPASDRVLRGRVAYIDPRVDPATRTAKVRIEVPNRAGDLRLGMYVTVAFTVRGDAHVLVPRAAVQSVGGRSVVYVPAEDDETRYVERPVRLGAAAGDAVQVVEGLRPGERVVTEGSFFLRAEAARTRSSG